MVTNRDDLEIRARSAHDCGRMPGEWFYSHYMYGSNYRLSEWQGAVLSQQLRRYPEQAKIRTLNAAFLDRELAKIDGITPQKQDPRCTVCGSKPVPARWSAALRTTASRWWSPFRMRVASE